MELCAAVIRMERSVLGCKTNSHFESQVPIRWDERIVMAMTPAMLKIMDIISQRHLPLKVVVLPSVDLDC